jgi:hypothetical protein
MAKMLHLVRRLSPHMGNHKASSLVCLLSPHVRHHRVSPAVRVPGMGEIGKQRQLNEKKQNLAVCDLGFYETIWILKFSLKHRLMNVGPPRYRKV